MRNALFALLAALTLSAGSGCGMFHGWGHHKGCDQCCDQGCGYCGPNCGACGPGGCKNGACAAGEGGCGCGDVAHNRCPCSPVPDCYTDRQMVADQLGGPPGPPTGQVTYPYYTTRGPRDFFAAHPPSIGP